MNDTNNLQQIAYSLPDNSVFTHDVGIRNDSGWQKQIPEDYGCVKIEKKYNSRVYIFYYPITPFLSIYFCVCFYIGMTRVVCYGIKHSNIKSWHPSDSQISKKKLDLNLIIHFELVYRKHCHY